MQFFSDAGSIKHISAKLGRVEGMLRHSILNCGSKPSSFVNRISKTESPGV